jgi:NADH-quinone oxidoreductase subunit B
VHLSTVPNGPYSERVDVHYVNLACCGVEAASAQARAASAALADVPGPDVVVVAGTVTAAAAEIVAAEIARVAEPRIVVAYGVCTITGGPYWDSYCVVPGIPADVVVPGCPPRPEALAAAVLEVRG